MLLEKLSDGAIVGPTARCLIADGFYRFKAGDRFFYDVKGQPGSFTTGKNIIPAYSWQSYSYHLLPNTSRKNAEKEEILISSNIFLNTSIMYYKIINTIESSHIQHTLSILNPKTKKPTKQLGTK